jgi:hypothetical protein
VDLLYASRESLFVLLNLFLVRNTMHGPTHRPSRRTLGMSTHILGTPKLDAIVSDDDAKPLDLCLLLVPRCVPKGRLPTIDYEDAPLCGIV